MVEAQLYTESVGTINKGEGNVAFNVASKAEYDAASQSFKTAMDALDSTVNQWLQSHIDSSARDANYGDALDPATQSFVDSIKGDVARIREKINGIVEATDNLVNQVIERENAATSTVNSASNG